MSAKKILIVEDEAKLSRVLQLELEHEGYAVDTARSGKIGLEKAQQDDWDLRSYCYPNKSTAEKETVLLLHFVCCILHSALHLFKNIERHQSNANQCRNIPRKILSSDIPPLKFGRQKPGKTKTVADWSAIHTYSGINICASRLDQRQAVQLGLFRGV